MLPGSGRVSQHVAARAVGNAACNLPSCVPAPDSKGYCTEATSTQAAAPISQGGPNGLHDSHWVTYWEACMTRAPAHAPQRLPTVNESLHSARPVTMAPHNTPHNNQRPVSTCSLQLQAATAGSRLQLWVAEELTWKTLVMSLWPKDPASHAKVDCPPSTKCHKRQVT
jgi:hypothetical protein